MSTFEPGPLREADATRTEDGRWTLAFVRDLAHPPARVWAALTDPAQLGEWAPFRAERDLGEPGPTTLTMIDGELAVELPATVLRAEPPSLLEYAWGEDLLRWELTPTPAGTRLTLRHTVAGTDDLPRAAAGWHLCLDVAERLLDGDPVPPIRGRAALDHGWQGLHDAYAEELRGTVGR
ncbi:MAG: SRPBCC family protein [Hamadaea sp.]|nr:SRPBCC family protein [Hamadaea sp.]NUT02195.1 SRPBCC family protein [Hamadaea sp.]